MCVAILFEAILAVQMATALKYSNRVEALCDHLLPELLMKIDCRYRGNLGKKSVTFLALLYVERFAVRCDGRS